MKPSTQRNSLFNDRAPRGFLALTTTVAGMCPTQGPGILPASKRSGMLQYSIPRGQSVVADRRRPADHVLPRCATGESTRPAEAHRAAAVNDAALCRYPDPPPRGEAYITGANNLTSAASAVTVHLLPADSRVAPPSLCRNPLHP